VTDERKRISGGALRNLPKPFAARWLTGCFSQLAGSARVAVVNGAAGIVAFRSSWTAVFGYGFTVRRGSIVEIDILADSARLSKLDLAFLES